MASDIETAAATLVRSAAREGRSAALNECEAIIGRHLRAALDLAGTDPGGTVAYRALSAARSEVWELISANWKPDVLKQEAA